MPRSTSPTLESLLPSCETQSTAKIVLRDDSAQYLTTDEEGLNLGGHDYTSGLLRVGELKETLGQATNRVEVKVSNVDKQFGLNISSEDRLMELAEVEIRRLYRSNDDPETYEWKHFFTGKTANSVVNEQNVSFDVVPDTTAAGTCIATETLTPNNGWRFPEAPEQSPPGSGENPGDTDPCFIGKTKFVFFDKTSISFEELYQRREEFIGKKVALSFDGNKPVAGEIKAVFRHFVREYLKVTFDDRSVLGVTKEHPFFTEIYEYIAIGALQVGDSVFCDDGKLSRIEKIEPVEIQRGFWVYNAEIDHENYSVGKRVHNRKLEP